MKLACTLSWYVSYQQRSSSGLVGQYNDDTGSNKLMKIFIHRRKLVAENLTKHLTNNKKDEKNN